MTDTTACVYAALLLSDAGKPITAKNISAAIEASGLEVRPTVPILVERFVAKNSISSLIASAASSGAAAAPAPAAAPAAGGKADAAPAAGGKKAAPVEEEEDDFGMGGLF